MRSRIVTSFPADQVRPDNMFTDHDWVRHNEKALREKYGECYVVVFHEEVIVTGKTYT